MRHLHSRASVLGWKLQGIGQSESVIAAERVPGACHGWAPEEQALAAGFSAPAQRAGSVGAAPAEAGVGKSPRAFPSAERRRASRVGVVAVGNVPVGNGPSLVTGCGERYTIITPRYTKDPGKGVMHVATVGEA